MMKLACAALLAPLIVCLACSPSLTEPDVALGTKTGSAVVSKTPPADREPTSTAFTQVSVGTNHVCAVSDAGAVYCWGRNDARQVGDGTTQHKSAPTRVAGIEAATSVIAGAQGSCAIGARGGLTCWGTVAGRAFDKPTPIAGLTDVRAVAFDDDHACAVVARGMVRCWGTNEYGQLGVPDPMPAGRFSTVPDVTDAVSVLVNRSGSCALKSTGDAVCWGQMRPKFGPQTTPKSDVRAKPYAIAKLPPLERFVPSDGLWMCGISKDHALHCWGTHPQSPDEARPWGWEDLTQFAFAGLLQRCALAEREPVVRCSAFDNDKVAFQGSKALSGYTDVSKDAQLVGAGQTICLLDRGKLACFGSNKFGQLGIGEASLHADPFEVPGLSGVRTVVPFRASTCALKNDGKVACWGLGRSLTASPPQGLARRTDAATPREVEGLSDVTALFRGPRDDEACVTKANGELWCFLAGVYAFPGETSARARAFRPHKMLGMKNVASTARIVEPNVSGDWGDAYAVLTSGDVVAFRVKRGSEREQAGVLVADVLTKPITNLRGVKQMTTNSDRACALYDDGTVGCFALLPPFGTLNQPNADPRSTSPDIITISGVSDALEIGVGESFFARTKTGNVLRWGLGGSAATLVPTLGGATAITQAGAMCVARKDGVECERDPSGAPRRGAEGLPFKIETGPVASVAHATNTCVVLANGRVACWGWNRGGALGAPDRDESAVPLVVELPQHSTEKSASAP